MYRRHYQCDDYRYTHYAANVVAILLYVKGKAPVLDYRLTQGIMTWIILIVALSGMDIILSS